MYNNFISPEQEFKKAQSKSRIRRVFGFGGLLVAEFVVICGLIMLLGENDLTNRVSREMSAKNNEEIVTRTGVYEGETDFGNFEGEGKFVFESGQSYEGEFADNVFNGQGELKIPDEGIYTGDFVDAQKIGTGEFAWEDGSVYSGEWENDKMSGKGVYTSSEGVSYNGIFKDNAFYEGECVFENNTGEYLLKYKDGTIERAFISFTDGTKYEGDASPKTISGNGIMTFANEDTYNGSYYGGKRNGKGKYTWSFGDTYDGEWENDNMSGDGVYVFADGTTISGQFQDNKFYGGDYHIVNDFGDYTFTITEGEPKSVKIVLANGTEYNGDMKSGALNGHALIKYGNGDKYDGNVSDGVKSGQGVYSWQDGATYSGDWSDDLMSGRGVYMYPSGSDAYKLSGDFKNGVPDGTCDYYTTASTHYQTEWSGGKCTKVIE